MSIRPSHARLRRSRTRFAAKRRVARSRSAGPTAASLRLIKVEPRRGLASGLGRELPAKDRVGVEPRECASKRAAAMRSPRGRGARRERATRAVKLGE